MGSTEAALSTNEKTPDTTLGTPLKSKSVVEPSNPENSAEAGPMSPDSVEPSKDLGPATGGYDDHTPSRHPTNKKGGYGAG